MIYLHRKVKITLAIIIIIIGILLLSKDIIIQKYNNFILGINIEKVQKIVINQKEKVIEDELIKIDKEREAAIEELIRKYENKKNIRKTEIINTSNEYISKIKDKVISDFKNGISINKNGVIASYKNYIYNNQIEFANIFSKDNTLMYTKTSILESESVLKVKKKIIKRNLEYKEIKQQDSPVILLSSNDILDYGYTFNSFDNYKNNGINFYDSYYNLHYGIDYKTMPDKYIDLFFPTDKHGIVVKADYTEAYGNRLIIVDQQKKEMFEYMHLSKINVKKGDTVLGGTKIGITGNSGKFSQGYHLHFAFYKNGFYVPLDLKKDVNNEYILKNISGLHNDIIQEILKEGKAEPFLMIENITGLIMGLEKDKQTISNLKNMVSIFIKEQEKGIFRLSDIIKNNRNDFKKLFGDKKVTDIVKITVKNVDKIHKFKKDIINGKKIITKNSDKNKEKKENFVTFIDNRVKDYPIRFGCKVKNNIFRINEGEACKGNVIYLPSKKIWNIYKKYYDYSKKDEIYNTLIAWTHMSLESQFDVKAKSYRPIMCKGNTDTKETIENLYKKGKINKEERDEFISNKEKGLCYARGLFQMIPMWGNLEHRLNYEWQIKEMKTVIYKRIKKRNWNLVSIFQDHYGRTDRNNDGVYDTWYGEKYKKVYQFYKKNIL